MICICPEGHIYDDWDRSHECPHNITTGSKIMVAVTLLIVFAIVGVYVAALIWVLLNTGVRG